MPDVKLVTWADLARRWHDLVHVDAGRILSENRTLETMGTEVFETILAVARGQKTCAKRFGLSDLLALYTIRVA